MCFSASASFIVAGALAITGLLSVYMVKNKAFFRIASVPLFFGLQQAAEGVVWLTIDRVFFISQLAAYAYLFFSLMFWPVWISWSLLPIERQRWRRLILYATLAAGAVFALASIIMLLLHRLEAMVVDHHIFYKFGPTTHLLQAQALYFFAAVIPLLISSRRTIQGFGTAVAVAFVISQIFYQPFFISTWCFFAAFVSIFVFIIIRREQYEPKK
jgi:hypothetical protein